MNCCKDDFHSIEGTFSRDTVGILILDFDSLNYIELRSSLSPSHLHAMIRLIF